jgi:hypothetical protein
MAFNGQQRWVEVSVGAQTLAPRQAVNSAPAAQFATTCCSPNTVVVSGGADAPTNGVNLLDALTRIAAQAPTASNAFLVKLEPGVFDVGSTPVQLIPFVRIEGSGEGISRITGTGQAAATSGVIVAANNAQLSELTVQSRAGNSYSTGVYVNGTVNTFGISHVAVQVMDGSVSGTGISNGGSTSIENITVTVSNTTSAGKAFGISNSANAAQIRNGSIQVQTAGTGQANGIFNNNGAAPMIGNVQITVSTSGAPLNAASPDAIGITNDNAAPLIQSVNITSSTTGGGSGVGIALNNSSTTLATTTVENSDIVVNSSGASFTQGVLNNTGSGNPAALVMRSSSVTVSGTSKTNCQVFGVNSFGAPTAVYNTSVTTSAGTGCLAAIGLILQGGPNDLTFNNGLVNSTNYAIYNTGSGAKIKIGAAQLSAPTTSSGSAVCVNSFKSDYTATTATCS